MKKETIDRQLRLNFDQQPQIHQHQTSELKPRELPWINVAPNSPYFVTDRGEDWTPIGQNDAITWPELQGVFRRKDLETAERYLDLLRQHGVTCVRLMLEYCHGENRYLEKPVGYFQPNMVKMWDDIFALCTRYGIRILLTPYDTFWMWLRWSKHPYKKTNGGPAQKRNQWLLCGATRSAIKQRLAFATERWGASGALFAWDLWNEIHPTHGGNNMDCFSGFVQDVSSFLRKKEIELYGRAHPQTVSVFGPVLNKGPLAAECTFRHGDLDFASVHFYESKTIDNPRNTVDAALSTGRLTRDALAHITNQRPFFDSEHGPIHSFKDQQKTLPEPFDDEYFRHMQWAHFASGGAGGGMRWPNRHPHSLTKGMRIAQQSLAGFLPLISWQRFNRCNLNNEIQISEKGIAAFGCGDAHQAIVWLLRTDSLGKDGRLASDAIPKNVFVLLHGLSAGTFIITGWNTAAGAMVDTFQLTHTDDEAFKLTVRNFVCDRAFAISKA